ncbi:hypothetical protein ABZ626_10575 [Streptomyces longispororuber]
MHDPTPFEGLFADREVRVVPGLDLIYTKKEGDSDTPTETDDL